MKIHDENCKNCFKIEGEEYCFDDTSEMHEHHKSQERWYEKAWNFVYYPCWRAADKIRYFPKEVKWFVQRGQRGWSDQDAWSVYDHLSEIMPPMIRQMSENSKGTPVAMFSKKAQKDAYNGYTKAQEKAAERKWKNVLETIAMTFEIEQGISSSEILDIGPSPDEETIEWTAEHCKKFDVKLLTEEQRKIRKRGWNYLQTYFQNLWD